MVSARITRLIGWRFALALLLVLLALPVFAQAPSASPGPTPDPSASPVPAFTWASYSFTKTVRTQGNETHQIFGASLSANYRLPAGFRVYARAEATRAQDGGQVDVDIYKPDTYSDLESLVGVTYRVYGPLHLAAFGGVSLPFVAGQVQVLNKYPKTMFAGLSLAVANDIWGYIGYGKHEPSGEGPRFLLAGQYHLHDKVSLVGEAAIGRGSYYRGGVAYKLN